MQKTTGLYTHIQVKSCTVFFVCMICGCGAYAVQCSPGNVLVNNQCVSCKSKSDWANYAKESRSFCPGVQSDANLSFEQQIRKCPNGSWPNANLTDCKCEYGLRKQNNKCVGALSKDDLLYGPSGKIVSLSKQCLIQNDTMSYKRCMGFDAGDDENNECGYVVLGRAGDNVQFSYIAEKTNLSNNAILVHGAGGWNGDVAAVKAVKSNLANTSDGCACPTYSFRHKGQISYFYNWDNSDELESSIEAMRTLNPGVALNKGFACLLKTHDGEAKYSIKFSFACDTSATPNPNLDTYNILFSAPDIATNTNKPTKTVVSVCASSNKTIWRCETLLKNKHYFYLDPSKTYKENTSLGEYINTYGATDFTYVTQGLQRYGNARESEMIVTFCTPSDLP